jgi:diguanylate cyclase (GGDEF)-like protein
LGRIILPAALITLAVIAITQAVSYATWGGMDGGYELSIVVAGTLIPISTCFPISMFLLLQRRKLADALARLELAHQRLRERSSRDQMTGLLHRQAFFEHLATLGSPAGAFLMIDVDHFKSINDTSGHAAGDDALRLIAGALGEAEGDGSIVARFGGEEFCAFLPHASAFEGENLAEKIRRRIGKLDFAAKGNPRRLTVSIGVASSLRGSDAETAIGEADAALYKAKAQGRNRVVVSHESGTGSGAVRIVA